MSALLPVGKGGVLEPIGESRLISDRPGIQPV